MTSLTSDPMTPEDAAARLSLALRPGATVTGPTSRALEALRVYSQFAREVIAEAGADVLADIVREVERHAAVTRTAPLPW